MYKVVLSKKAEKQLDKIPNQFYWSIKESLINLESNPRPFGYKKLIGYSNLYRPTISKIILTQV